MEIFNFFGGNKKKVSQGSRGNQEAEVEQQQQPQSLESNSGFVFVAQDHNPAYYRPGATILTNENIRGMGSSVSLNDKQVYPSLDLSNAEPAESLNASSLHMPSTGRSITPKARHASPLDNIPFVFQNPGSSSGGSLTNGGTGDDFKEIADRVRRVESFVQSSNFIYNFQLESSILRQTA